MVRIDREAPRRFLQIGYEPNDWVAVLLKSYDTGDAVQRILSASTVMAPRFLAWLRFRNAARWNIYLSVNALVPGHSRTKAAVAGVRHVFLDVDADGQRFLNQLALRRDLPAPSYVLHTSPGRTHVLWRVHQFDVDRVEAIQRHLARTLGTDSAATASSQMTRLPGFVNYKHEVPHLVRVEYRASGALFEPQDFPKPQPTRAQNTRAGRRGPVVTRMRRSPLERARRYLARIDPAIAGQHGDLRTFRTCCRLVRGFALTDDEAISLLVGWNGRCEPPWSEQQLRDKLTHARRYGREPLGGLVSDDHQSAIDT